MSQPLCIVTIAGTPANVTAVTVDEPEGAGGGTCQIVLAGVAEGIDPAAHIIVSLGYVTPRGDDVEVVFDSTAVSSTLYSIEIEKDTITASWGTKLDARFDVAPSESEVFKVNGGGLHGIMRHVICSKIGYDSFRGSIPNVAVPREIRFEPEEAYWSALTRLLTGFKPIVLPDDSATPTTLGLWWLDKPLHGEPRVLPFSKAEAISFPKEIRKIVNQALIRYYPQGRDGRSRPCSGQTDTFVSDETGHVIATSGGDCGDDHVDLETQGPSGTAVRTFREDSADGTSNVTHWFRTWADGREVEYKIKTVLLRPSSREVLSTTTVNILHLAGTNFETVSGTRSVTDAWAKRPGVGLTYCRRLKVENEVISFFQVASEPGVWKQHTKRRRTIGYALYPERVMLEAATANDGVDSSSATYQYDVPETLCRTRNEYVASVTPTQMVGRWEEVDVLRDVRSSDETSEKLGRQASKDDGPEIIEELVQDQTSIGVNGARTAVVIDATWIGAETERPNGAGSDATVGRDWAIAQALAMFRRSGKGEVQLSETFPKYFRSIRRGSLVRGHRRGGARPATYIITGRRVSFRMENGVGRLQSDLTGRRAAVTGEQA